MQTQENAQASSWYGCIFCRTGYETRVARELEERWPDVIARAVMVTKWRSDHGQKRLVTEVLIAGYVFFRAPENYSIGGELPDNAWKILRTGEDSWRLSGRDEWFAAWLLKQNGTIGVSKACRVGDRIQIRQRPLKDLEGSIIRVDKRGRSGQVELVVNGRTLRVWLSFELLDESVLPDESMLMR